MKYLLWLLKAAIFFTLFAFALNNQHDATVYFFFGTYWRAPLVLVVLAAFAGGLRGGRAGHAAGLVEAPQRRGASACPAETRPAHRPPRPRPRRSDHLPPPTCPPYVNMDFDLQLAAAQPARRLRAGLARLALRPAAAQAREPPSAQGLLPRPQLPAQRAAGPGHRRLHRGRAERPRHAGAALRAGHPVPPPRRVPARRARARAPAGPRRPEPQPTATAHSTRWRKTSCAPACSTAPKPRCRSSKARATRTRRGCRCWPSTSARAEWAQAADVAQKLDESDQASYSTRRAHHLCEQATERGCRRRPAWRGRAARQAVALAPQAPRPAIDTANAAAAQRRCGRRLRHARGPERDRTASAAALRSRAAASCRGRAPRRRSARTASTPLCGVAVDRRARGADGARRHPDRHSREGAQLAHAARRLHRASMRSSPRWSRPRAGSRANTSSTSSSIRRCSARSTRPPGRSCATTARPAVSRRTSTSGTALAARPGTATRRGASKSSITFLNNDRRQSRHGFTRQHASFLHSSVGPGPRLRRLSLINKKEEFFIMFKKIRTRPGSS